MNLPIIFQRIEGGALFMASTFVYFNSGFSWVWYALLLLAFDVSMVGYLVNQRLGAISYNVVHSLVLPSALVVVYLFMPSSWLLALICLWFAHIGLDRSFGYGLKQITGFKHTHLSEL